MSTEGLAGNGLVEKLVDAIEKGGGNAAAGPLAPLSAVVKVFYDRRCLNAAESWELGLKNGLEGASLVMPLVSAGALKGMIDDASMQRDNLLMEWETALERSRQGKCLVLPIFITDPKHADANGKPKRVDFREASYPDAPHFLSGINIRTTLSALFKINGVKLALDRSGAPDPAQLAEAVHHVHLLIGSPELQAVRRRAQQEYQNEQENKDKMWKRVEAIIDGNDVIGSGASSIVYRGKLDPTMPDERFVAVKALKSDAGASKQFSTELEIMKGLKVRSIF